MKKIHVECNADELLVKKLGFTRKMITHHSGKSKLFNNIRLFNNELALVDEDPGSPKTSYEKKLKYISESYGVKQYTDHAHNHILVLGGKLEDWLVSTCKDNKIDLQRFNLPSEPNRLHEITSSNHLNNYERLLDHLLVSDIPAINTLKELLNKYT